MFYEKNRAALLHHPEASSLLERLDVQAPASDVQILQAADGGYVLQYQSVCLNDRENPLAEAKEVIHTGCRPGKNASHVLLGLGLGYLANALYTLSPGNIYIYEPDMALLRFVLESMDYSEVLSAGRVFLFVDSHLLLDHLRYRYVAPDPLDLLYLPRYGAFQSEQLNALKQGLSYLAESAMNDISIIQNQHSQWMETLFKNIHHFPKAHPVNMLQEKFSGKPALVISSGPSLDPVLDDIRSIQDKVVTIAVGRSLRTLLENGIIPDFTVFADYVGIEAQVYKLSESVKETNFLLPPFVDPHCYEVPSLNKFLLLSENTGYIAEWLDEVFQTSHCRMRQVAPVSLSAFHSALFMGCNPIILVGQDLAYHGTQIYAGGLHGRIDEESGTSVLEGNETLCANYAHLGVIRGQDGSLLRTNADYVNFAKQLEAYASENMRSATPRVLINASQGGAYLEGFQHQNLKAFCETNPLNVFDKTLENALLQDSEAEKTYRLMLSLSSLSRGMQQAQTAAEAFVKVITQLEELPDSDWTETLKAYEAKRLEFSKIIAKHCFIMPSIYHQLIEHRILEQDEVSLRTKIAWAKRYYTAIIQGINQVVPWVKAAEERVSFSMAQEV